MNEVLRRRLVGLAVLLFGLFLLSWFVPGGDGRGVAPGTPSTLVPLGPDGAVEAPVQDAAANDSLPTADPSSAAPEPSPPSIADLSDDAKPASEPAKPEASMPLVPVAKPALKLAQAVERPVEAHKPTAAPAPKAEPPKAAAIKPAAAKAVEKPASPAKPATSTASAKPATASAAGWWIQIGSYSDRGKAETILSLLRKVGHHGELTTIKGQKGPLNRVRLGPYANEATARAALPKVAHQGYPQARVVSEPPAH